MSAVEARQAERKIAVCANCNCMKCPVTDVLVPDECEWAMKHILSTDKKGVVIDRPRRWGKTSRVLNLAAFLAECFQKVENGPRVMLFVPTRAVANDFQKRMMGTGVEILSVGDGVRGLGLIWLRGRFSREGRIWFYQTRFIRGL